MFALQKTKNLLITATYYIEDKKQTKMKSLQEDQLEDGMLDMRDSICRKRNIRGTVRMYISEYRG